MAYEKTIWKNREVERPRTYNIQENEDGTITLIPAEGAIIEPGTPITAQVMQNIEDGIEVLDNTLKSHMAQTANKIAEHDRALQYFWIPEKQPSGRSDEPGYFIDLSEVTANEFINGFESLRLGNEDYITRDSLGKDASGLYDVWRYVFEPTHYTKTIVLQSGLHGSEVTPVATMLRFFHYLVNEWEKHPLLAYIRHNVRIVYIPIVNPWGMSQSPKTRWNSNGVDLNRNFDYNWENYPTSNPFDHDYKGTAPFSEIEADHVRRNILHYRNADAFFDLHSTGSPIYDFYVATPFDSNEQITQKIKRVIEFVGRDKEELNINLAKDNNPTFTNYVFSTRKTVVGTIEWCDGAFGRTYGDTEITKSLEFFANIIIEFCNRDDATNTLSSNDENGDYILFENGTMICTFNPIEEVSITTQTNEEQGLTIYRGVFQWDFPKSFANIPVVNVSAQAREGTEIRRFTAIKTIAVTANYARIQVVSLTNFDNVNTINAIAIGKWK